MIDLLLRFPSKEVAVQVGQALGVTHPSDAEPGLYDTIQANETTAVCVIGEHFAPTGVMLTDGEGTSYPELAGDGQWWVMVRALDDRPIPPELDPYIVVPDPADASIPNRAWAS